MKQQDIPGGVHHELSGDLAIALFSFPDALKAWEHITPIARNEWICWVESAKKAETRAKRINQALENLSAGKKRPCCWPGCPHRRPNAQKWHTGKKQEK